MDLVNACEKLDLGEMAEITKAYVDLISAIRRRPVLSIPIHGFDLGESIHTEQGASHPRNRVTRPTSLIK